MKVKGWVSVAVFIWIAGQQLTRAQAATPGYVVYETDFEQTSGYDPRYVLGAPNGQGQNGWVAEGTGGNGLLTSFPGYGQQAYVGLYPPLDTNSFTTVWRPLAMNPISADQPVVKFSALMQIVPSTTGGQDDFRWSVYTTNGVRLFSLDFEGATGLISYILDDGQFISTDYTISYEPDGAYDVEIWMDLARNRWTALVNGEALESGLRMTTKATPLSVGDVDAVWAVVNTAAPGNNYMAFDNYKVSVEAESSIPPIFKTHGMDPDHVFRFDFYGEPGLNYEIEVTEDFLTWTPLGTFGVEEFGWFPFEDPDSAQFTTGFYRARQVSEGAAP
jgi:hypothetical protein